MFSKEIRFKYSWRTYQDRVLKEIESHLSDNKLHVIAPPGSGKTVLGLEVVRRLNKKTLILAPTITIRNQWVDRFVELFSNNTFQDYSFSLDKPDIITSSTYQSLHSAFTRHGEIPDDSDDEVESDESLFSDDFDILKTLKCHNIEVIVLDEAHHLKTEWWKSITAVIKSLSNVTVISLTATPPYDSTQLEWMRYMELCGPVDAEISVPELVKEKNLCPHQDLIFFSEPSESESEAINQFYQQINGILVSIGADREFEKIISELPAVVTPEDFSEQIYNDVESYASLIIFLQHKENPICRELQKVLGLESQNIPPLTGEWFETLLTFLIFKEPSISSLDKIKSIKKDLKAYSAIEHRKVLFARKPRFNKMLSSSISKFRSIRDIVNLEYNVLGDDLRLVILSDYVRKDSLTGRTVIDKFGVIPIFKYLNDQWSETHRDFSERMAVLSGSICIIPNSVIPRFTERALKYGMDESDIRFIPVPSYDSFSEIVLISSKKNLTVSIITDLITEGTLNIIIGTKSLLGEGWDCPAINSLVMATFIGSYMLSNQIRGRAIRSDRFNPRKTSNIWHLMCLDTANRENNYDHELLTLRFKCFSGLDSEDNYIRNGMDRLRLRNFVFRKLSITDLNLQMKDLALKREQLYERWFHSINLFHNGKIVKEIRTGKETIKQNFIVVKTLKFLVLQGIAGSALFTINLYTSVLRSFIGKSNIIWTDFSTITTLLLFVFILGSLPSTYRSLVLLFKHGSIAKSLKQIGLTLFDTMNHFQMFENPEKITIQTEPDSSGVINCCIRNCSSYEQSLFLSAMKEVVEPIQNPRYVMTREQKFLFRSKDYHAVPSIFGTKKEKAEIFYKYWQKRMGQSELYYTRHNEGRKVLVHARSNALSASFIDKTEIVDSWKN
jgi:superfamily II DNA or RNA helicase